MKRAEHQPATVSLTIFGGIYYRVWSVAEAGTLLPQHSHRYDHLTALLSGKVKVWCDGEVVGIFTAPAVVKIPAGKLHNFLTMAPSVVLACIHNADRIDGDEPTVTQHAHLELED